MTSFDELVTSLQKFVLSEEQTKDNTGLRLFSEKLTEYSRLVPFNMTWLQGVMQINNQIISLHE